ncbi:S1 family peptidase [Actinomadura sp. 3N508]|uniref:S1 family peptidase n=1 Tax=Actinomadura sp. 3N508 TaxID=3375153 RepID=UPI00378C9F42
MRPIPLTMLVSGTAIIVAAAPYMITQAPDVVSAPAPAPAPAPESEPVPDTEPVPESDSADQSARGYGARASGADPARGRGRDGDARRNEDGRASVVAPPVVAAPAPGGPGTAPKPNPGPDQGRTPDPKPSPDDDPTPDPDPSPDDDPPPPAHEPDPEPDPDEPHSLFGPPDPEGGETIFARDGIRCTLGFNVRKADSYYFLTTGACAKVGLKLYADPMLMMKLGTVVSVTNGTTALVRYVSPHVERPGSVGTPTGSHDVLGVQNPKIGQQVCRISPDTGKQCGTVTALNTSVTFPEGTITGLVKTTICTEPSDSPAGPFLSGPLALGLGFGVGGHCSSGGSTFFQPVDKVLNAFGAEVY